MDPRPLAALLLCSLTTVAGAQGQGSWGGAAGIVLAVIVISAIVFLFWVWGVWRVVKGVGIKGAFRVVVTLLISCSPLAYFSLESKRNVDAFNEGEQARRDLRAHAEQYITEKCATERKATNLVVLPAGTGIFLSEASGLPPAFANIPSAMPPTAKMKDDHDRWGSSYPNEAINEGQFRKPLYWTIVKFPSSLLAVGPAFVEFRDPKRQQKMRMASVRWWRKSTSPAEFQELLLRSGEKRNLEENLELAFPVDELKSIYDLEMRDVSTLGDRLHWAARGRIHLTRRSDKSLVAEYVGFAAAHQYENPNYNYWWEKISVCAGPEVKYAALGSWQPERYFFREVVRIEGEATPPR